MTLTVFTYFIIFFLTISTVQCTIYFQQKQHNENINCESGTRLHNGQCIKQITNCQTYFDHHCQKCKDGYSVTLVGGCLLATSRRLQSNSLSANVVSSSSPSLPAKKAINWMSYTNFLPYVPLVPNEDDTYLSSYDYLDRKYIQIYNLVLSKTQKFTYFDNTDLHTKMVAFRWTFSSGLKIVTCFNQQNYLITTLGTNMIISAPLRIKKSLRILDALQTPHFIIAYSLIKSWNNDVKYDSITTIQQTNYQDSNIDFKITYTMEKINWQTIIRVNLQTLDIKNYQLNQLNLIIDTVSDENITKIQKDIKNNVGFLKYVQITQYNTIFYDLIQQIISAKSTVVSNTMRYSVNEMILLKIYGNYDVRSSTNSYRAYFYDGKGSKRMVVLTIKKNGGFRKGALATSEIKSQFLI